MKTSRRALLAVSAVALFALAPAHAAAPATKGWQDVLDTPAIQSARAQRSLYNGLARAGDRIVAAGQRGQILYSDNGGRDWKQAEVPLSADLVAVSFAGDKQGWAVGHGSVILHTTDGGQTWVRQFDGRQLGEAMAVYANGGGGAASATDPKALEEDAKRFAAQGAETSLLDVWFQDESTGYAVGAFGLILRTVDGGAHWTPFLHAVDNPKGLHLYTVRGIAGNVYIAGEQGLLLKLDRNSGRFRAIELPYKGTLFGIVGNDHAVVVHGLRGTVLRSTDAGASWHAVTTGLQAGLTASTRDEQGRIVIASQAGHVLVSSDDGATFTPIQAKQPIPAAAVIAAPKGALVVAGPRGVFPLEQP
jgi:photosystem II stability/assembly factor-like uncharacterized protein